MDFTAQEVTIPHDLNDDVSVLSDSSGSEASSDEDSVLSFESDESSDSSGESSDDDMPTMRKAPKSKLQLLEFYDMHNRARASIAPDHPYEIKVYRRKEGASGPRRSYQLVSTNADKKGLYKMISRDQAGQLGYPKNSSFA
jgi:hypothetical protein